MTAKVIYSNNQEADVMMSDGGVATFHHNGEHMLTTYYQDRVVAEELEEDETIWDRIGQGKASCNAWEDKQEVDDEMIEDAIEWLAPGYDVSIKKILE